MVKHGGASGATLVDGGSRGGPNGRQPCGGREGEERHNGAWRREPYAHAGDNTSFCI